MINIHESSTDQKVITKLLRSVGFVKKKSHFGQPITDSWYYEWGYGGGWAGFTVGLFVSPEKNETQINFRFNYGKAYMKKYDDPDGKKIKDFIYTFTRKNRLQIYKTFENIHSYHAKGGTKPPFDVARSLVEYTKVVTAYMKNGNFGKYETKGGRRI